MHHILATLHVFGIQAADRVRARAENGSERGNVTMEQVLWAVAVIAIVGIVVSAVTGFVQRESNKLGG